MEFADDPKVKRIKRKTIIIFLIYLKKKNDHTDFFLLFS